jgi:hypothetical protein
MYFGPKQGISEMDVGTSNNTVLAPVDLSLIDGLRNSAFHYLRQMYKHNRLVDLQEIPHQKVRAAIEKVLPAIFFRFDPEDPTRPDEIEGCSHKVKLLIFMRKDQYVKKAWSKLKTTLGLELLQNLTDCKESHWLTVNTVKRILTDETIFNQIFDHDAFRKTRTNLNKQTNHDIETIFLSRFRPFFAGDQTIEDVASYFQQGRCVKTPFTYLENNTSLIVLLDQFTRQLKKMDSIPPGTKQRMMKRLDSIREELTARL